MSASDERLPLEGDDHGEHDDLDVDTVGRLLAPEQGLREAAVERPARHEPAARLARVHSFRHDRSLRTTRSTGTAGRRRRRKREQRHAELPVVGEPVSARPHHHQVRRGRHRREERRGGRHGHGHQHRLGGHVELGSGRHRDRDHDQRGRHVADQLAEDGGEQEEAEEQRMRPGVADEVDEPRRRASRPRPWSTIAVESGIMPATRITVVHAIPRYAWSTVSTPRG